ncbi:MAG: glycosyltransferase family 39 protein, partial [Chloroflexota bacterium]|nr:glycosyltransferase family 39 protein [Chloroflexota bacterium]
PEYSSTSWRSWRLSSWFPFFTPLLIATGLSIVFLVGVYRLPQHSMHDAGSLALSASGLHAPEKAGPLTYAYTAGDASLWFPQTGTGQFMARLRMGGPMGGPGGNFPVKAQLATQSQRVDLGVLEHPRIYHLLVPANANGDVQLQLQSTTMLLQPDPRQLGVLLDWIALRALGPATPPASVFASTPLILLLLWLAITQLETSSRWKVLFLVFAGVALCITYAIYRGRTPLQLWWIGAALSAVVGMSLSRFDARRFTTPLRGIVFLFAAWRLALWLIAALGLWYSSAVYRYAKQVSFDFGRAVFGHEALVWRTLAASWMQWDSEHYQAIALDGYAFAGERYPNIAFFPLYPLLIRLFLPITGNNVAVAALLVSHLALFAALLLLYDLLARDFDRVVAYRTLVLLLVFPTSFFLVAGYSEALALALAVATLWAMRRQRWWLAGIAGCLLALARVPGVMIAPVLAVAYLQHHNWRWRSIRPNILAVLLPPLGLALFMLYQWWRFDTPWAFLIAQQSWNNPTTPPWVMFNRMLGAIQYAPEWEMALVQLIVWVSFVVLTLLALLRLPLPYGLTVLLLLLPAYLANQRGSVARHVLIGFPAFVALAICAQQRWQRWLIISAMLPLLAIGTLLFVNGFWVA